MGDKDDSDLGVFDDIVKQPERSGIEPASPADQLADADDDDDEATRVVEPMAGRPPQESYPTLAGMGGGLPPVAPVNPMGRTLLGTGPSAPPPPPSGRHQPPPSVGPRAGEVPPPPPPPPKSTPIISRPPPLADEPSTLTGLGRPAPPSAPGTPPPAVRPPAQRTLLGMGKAPPVAKLATGPLPPPAARGGKEGSEFPAVPPPPTKSAPGPRAPTPLTKTLPISGPALSKSPPSALPGLSRPPPIAPPSAPALPPPSAPAASAPSGHHLPPVAAPPSRGLRPADMDWDDAPGRGDVATGTGSGRAASVAPGAPPARRSKILMFVAMAMVTAVAVLVVAFLMPRTGTLIVTVSGPGGAVVDGARVLIDGVLRCEQSPCRVDQLKAGAHTVRVEAKGYVRPADRAVGIEAGGDAVMDFTLAEDEVTRTGLSVGALGKGVRLFVDGEDRGTLPATVDGLEPGEHTVRLVGGARYEDWEKKLTLEEGDFEELKPELVAKKATLSLRGGRTTKGAEITLICGDEQQLILDLPKKVQISLDQECKVQAVREKYELFVAEITFGENETKKTLHIELEKEDPKKKKKKKVRIGAKPDKPDKPDKPAGGKGSIAINSIPQSSVLVDGRPVGRTPTQVTVAPGPHSVTFMHPTKGRRSRSVNVKPGKTAVAAVKF